jgi:thiol-disulfide isomerase/thioredoxin
MKLNSFLAAKRTMVSMLAVLCSLALSGCHRPSSNANGPTPVVSRPGQTNYPMPPLKGSSEMGWTLASDQHIRLADVRDKVMVLDFYATWCAPCRESTPRLVELQKRYGPQGLQVVGLNVGGRDDYNEVPDYAREFHIQYQLGIPDSEMENLYLGDDNRIPQTFVLDRQGKLVRRFVGYDDSMGRELEETIQRSLTSMPAKQTDR